MTMKLWKDGSFPAVSIVLPVAVLAVLLSAAACSPQAPQIVIENASAEMSPVFIGAGSIYLKLRNNGGRDTLTGAAIAHPTAVVELHDVKDNRMVRVGSIAVPSREVVELKPGSFHIMIFNMPKSVQKGSELALTLRFERSGDRPVQVKIAK